MINRAVLYRRNKNNTIRRMSLEEDERQNSTNDGLSGGAASEKDIDTKNPDHVSNREEDDKTDGGEEKVSFSSLNAVEREVLVKKLRKEILKDTEKAEMCCYAFLDWVFEQFKYVKADPPSTVLFSNLEYISKHCGTPDLFVREGNHEVTNLHFDCICNSVEPDYALDDLDIYSLATATLRYVKEKVEFFDSELYERLSEVYERDEEIDFTMKRMPFVVSNRDTLIEIRDLFGKMEESRDASSVGRSKMTEIWAGAIIKWDLSRETDSIDLNQKTRILKSLFDAEFTYVPVEFYH